MTTTTTQRAERRSGWRLFGEFLRLQRVPMAAGIGAALVMVAARVSVPLLVAAAINEGVVGGDERALVRFAVLVVVVGFVHGAADGVRRIFVYRVDFRGGADLRERLYTHYQKLDFTFHDGRVIGDLLSRANTDTLRVSEAVSVLCWCVANVLTLLAVATVMMVRDPALAALTLAPLPLLQVATIVFSRRQNPIGAAVQRELGALAGTVEESFSGIRVVKGFGAEEVHAGRVADHAGVVFEESLRAVRMRSWYLPFVDFLPTSSLVIVLWFGGHRVMDGRLGIGDLVAFGSYVLILAWPIRATGFLVSYLAYALASAVRIQEVLSIEPRIVDPDVPRVLAPGHGEIRLEHVRFAYDGRTPVVEDLDLVIAERETVALVGPPGSAKSTIARLIARLYDVDSGRVLIDGTDVRELAVGDVRRAVGIVFEDTFLFTASLRDNVAFGAPSATDEAVWRALELAGAREFVDRLPEGLNTAVGEHGFTLSGGQRQRVAIARVLLTDPRVLILDEATSAVDPGQEHEIRGALRAVMANRTTIVITHRVSMISLADRVVLLDGGHIVDSGTHSDLLSRSERYCQVLATVAGSDR